MKDTIIGLFIGIAIAFLGVYLTGFSAAIAVPEQIGKILSGSSFIIWEVAVTQFLGYGVVTFLLLFFAVKFFKPNPWLIVLSALIACEAVLFIAYSSSYTIYIPHFLIVIGCAVLGAYLAVRQNSTSKAAAE
ncbi:hypothetical protein [uncultured Gilvimarinus sp.]|uniref:hypothetical protein n=1 Tax=uncultured Gilvimarinus sp. TaxID=1689143 RepID=UPI0030EC46F0